MEAAVVPAQVSAGRWDWRTLVRHERFLSSVVLLVILLLALALRTYRLPELMQVGGDQGRDALVVEHMLRTGEAVLQGPIASIGTYHRGPAYYYLLAIAYWLSSGNPIGGVLLSVGFDLAAIVMAFVLVRDIAGRGAGLATAALWAVSPILLLFVRSQWNPQEMIFFALLSIYAATRIARGDGRWLLVLAPAWLIAWQLHDPALFLIPLLGLILAWRWRVWVRLRLVVGAVTLGGLVMLPFIVQQVTHHFTDVRAMLDYLLGGITGAGPPAAVPSIIDRIFTAMGWLPRALPGPDTVNLVIIALGLVGLSWALWRAIRMRSAEAAVLVLFAATPLLYGLWRAPFYAHYLLLIYALPLMLAGVGVGALVQIVARRARRPAALWAFAASGLAVIVSGSAFGAFTTIANAQPDSRRWDNRLGVVRQVIADADGRPFAFRLKTDLEPLDGWHAQWDYVFIYTGTTPDPLRVDLPTYVIFDPADFAAGSTYGGHLAEGIRWVAFPPPTFGDNLLSDAWQFSGQGTGTIDSATSSSSIELALDVPHGYTDAAQTVAVQPMTRYLVRFDYRTDTGVDGTSSYAQVFDAGGTLLTTLPTGSGNRHGPAAEWTTTSFIGQVPSAGAAVKVIVRCRGAGRAWFANVELRPVTGDSAPW